ncbi:MAG: TetR/AcrR family transcriptional regulator [Solirubrobacteraceae bacterium]|nr:TetR/AcrR family transcriptional regulator [Solirubrobacteraceae bacterium]
MTGRPRGDHPDHQDLVDAAQRCFLEAGYANATMRDIAEEAGTSTSRLYVAFENKQAMLVAVLSAANTRLLNGFLIPALNEPVPPWDRVMALVEAYLRFYTEERELATLMATTRLDPEDPDPAMRELVATQQAQMERLTALIRELTDDHDNEIDASHVVRWAWAAVYGVASINMRLPHLSVDDDELDRIVGLGMRFIRAGLREAGKLSPTSR